MTERIDILIVDALKMELAAIAGVLAAQGVTLERREIAGIACEVGTLQTAEGARSVALARPTRMGSLTTATTASALVTQLRPHCLAMSGVCAGNPGDTALGDVVIAETAYAYDEGKRTAKGFEGDHRQIPIADTWLRLAQDMSPESMRSYGAPSDSDRRDWLIEQLAVGADPARHPARARYLEGGLWEAMIRRLEDEKIIARKKDRFHLTRAGRDEATARRAYGMAPIERLPFAIHAGPIASGNVVVKDGITWDALKSQGVRTALGLEMEAAAIARVAHNHEVPRWVVAKGVMDYADPKKDDRYKAFAATASAEVLIAFLKNAPLPRATAAAVPPSDGGSTGNGTNIIGNVTGSGITINQVASSSDR